MIYSWRYSFITFIITRYLRVMKVTTRDNGIYVGKGVWIPYSSFYDIWISFNRRESRNLRVLLVAVSLFIICKSHLLWFQIFNILLLRPWSAFYCEWHDKSHESLFGIYIYVLLYLSDLVYSLKALPTPRWLAWLSSISKSRELQVLRAYALLIYGTTLLRNSDEGILFQNSRYFTTILICVRKVRIWFVINILVLICYQYTSLVCYYNLTKWLRTQGRVLVRFFSFHTLISSNVF